jgi:UDPglucose 6-dehydrogenase
MKIGFIGVGKLGMPCAEAVAQKGHDVSAYDVAERESKDVNMFSTIADTVHDRDIVFIAVPTPHDPLYDGNAPTAHLTPKDFEPTCSIWICFYSTIRITPHITGCKK